MSLAEGYVTRATPPGAQSPWLAAGFYRSPPGTPRAPGCPARQHAGNASGNTNSRRPCPFLMSNSPLAPKSGSLRPNVRPTNGWKHSDEEQVPGLVTCLERPAPNRRLLGFGGLWVTEALSTVDPPTPGLSASQGDRWRVTPDSGQVLWPADKGPRGVPSAADGCLHPAAQGLGPAAATRCSGRWHLLLQLLRVAAPAQLRHPRAFTP